MYGPNMATQTRVVLECDFCHTSDPSAHITTRTLTVDGKGYEGEACDSCYEPVQTALGRFISEARKVPRKYGKRKTAALTNT